MNKNVDDEELRFLCHLTALPLARRNRKTLDQLVQQNLKLLDEFNEISLTTYQNKKK